MTAILGDLLEEYREVILPARGRIGATLWFAGQFVSLLKPWMWGLILGITLGVANLVSTAVAPLADDPPPTILSLGVAILASWVFAGFAAERRSRRFSDAIAAGVIVAMLATGIFSAANFARKMIFLDTLQHRRDWQGLVARYHSSGARDLRSFVVTEHLQGLAGGILFSLAAGAVCGGLGGSYSIWRREQPSRMDVT